jgi:hypothetical protein
MTVLFFCLSISQSSSFYKPRRNCYDFAYGFEKTGGGAMRIYTAKVLWLAALVMLLGSALYAQDGKAGRSKAVAPRVAGNQPKDLREMQWPEATIPDQWSMHMSAAAQAILAGTRKYISILVPILAIYAVPHDLGPAIGNDPAARAAFEARDEANVEAQAKALENGIPSARIVRSPRANHYVCRSNEADVLREMKAFSPACHDYFQPTVQPTAYDVLHDFRVLWQSPRFL